MSWSISSRVFSLAVFSKLATARASYSKFCPPALFRGPEGRVDWCLRSEWVLRSQDSPGGSQIHYSLREIADTFYSVNLSFDSLCYHVCLCSHSNKHIDLTWNVNLLEKANSYGMTRWLIGLIIFQMRAVSQSTSKHSKNRDLLCWCSESNFSGKHVA